MVCLLDDESCWHDQEALKLVHQWVLKWEPYLDNLWLDERKGVKKGIQSAALLAGQTVDEMVVLKVALRVVEMAVRWAV